MMTEGTKLDNPLPEPVQGRQKPPEFAINGREEEKAGLFTDLNRSKTPAGEPPMSSKTSAEDDFDFPVAEDDDFDLK